ERQAMAVCDRPKPPPAESCTQIQLYRGAQVDTPELRYCEVGVDISFQSSGCNELIPAFCMENILTLPDSHPVANSSFLPVVDCTDLEIFEVSPGSALIHLRPPFLSRGDWLFLRLSATAMMSWTWRTWTVTRSSPSSTMNGP
ncbi:hypothetical protein FOZ60_014871, partial [Perkinsus olseni]